MSKFVEFTNAKGKRFSLQPSSIKFIEESDKWCILYTRNDRSWQFRYEVKETYDVVLNRIAETVNKKVSI